MKDLLLVAYRRAIAPLSGKRLRRFKLVDRAHRLVTGRLAADLVRIRDHEMYLDPNDTLYLQSGQFELFETELVERLLKPGQTVVDVGAAIGYYTLIFARRVGPQGKVYAFEPGPQNFRILRKNVRLNGYRNVTLEQAALSDRTGHLNLYLAPTNVGDHRVFDYYRDRPAVRVRSSRLDDYLRAGDGRIDFIKMDIQGGEWAALNGMEATLARNPQIMVLTEYSPRLLYEFGVEPERYLRRLQEHGFTLYEVDESQRRLPRTDPQTLSGRYRRETEDYTNLLCVRGELAAGLLG